MTVGAELRELAERYAAAVDRADAAAVAQLFTPDGELVLFMQPGAAEPTGIRRGRAEIETALGALSSYRATHHTISSHVVTSVDGDTATAETRCAAHHVETEGDGWRDRVLYATYTDTCRRTEAGWQFVRRQLRVQWVSLLPVDG
ncbi:MAG TPA: nuclear transport factor 2 family protein [Mycobacteriales bacterium]|nr:nuclear transport factor 2 family protein [Mycobacteriales bacterium]